MVTTEVIERNTSRADIGVLTVHEVATILRTSRATIYRLMVNGELPYTQIGGQRRILRDQLDDYLTAGQRNVAPR